MSENEQLSQESSDAQDKIRNGVGSALGRIPSGLFILTASHEDRRLGILTSWVQQVSMDPPMVSIAVRKGRAIMPLISEARQFGICQLAADDRLILRKFMSVKPGQSDDPFMGFEMIRPTVLGVPILANVLSYLECEMTCHMDVDGDHDLFIGIPRAGNFLSGEPHVHLREHGFKY